MKRGDVVLMDYPFSDGTGHKVRPALVVLADAYLQKLSHTVVAPITSSPARFVGDPSQLVIEDNSPAALRAGLRLRSVIQCESLLTLRNSFVVRTLGSLPPAVMRQIDECLKSALGLL